MTFLPANDPNYFDHAATSPMCDAAVEELSQWRGVALNPSSIHQTGQGARRLLEEAREQLAALLGLPPSQVVFTGSATESANLALRGTLSPQSNAPRRRRVVLSAVIEHSCIVETLDTLVHRGEIEVRPMPVTESGHALPHWEEDGPLDMVCLMHANNETGVLQDTVAARATATTAACPLLCDASQSFGKVPCANLGADLLIAASHKIGGPPGIALLAGPGIRALSPQVTGGGQEDGLRGGTPAVALARAFAAAAQAAHDAMERETARLQGLEQLLFARLTAEGVRWQLNGGGARLPGFLNLSVEGLEAVETVIALDAAGFCLSPGSACSTGVVAVSPVLTAMFPGDEARAKGGIRLSMGPANTAQSVIGLAAELGRIARRRESSRGTLPAR
jgi:cysteine desulfurase